MFQDINKSEIHSKINEWDIEKTIDSNEVSIWLAKNINIALACAMIYVAAVFSGKRFMLDREKLNLRKPMMIWSLLLAIFSIFGSVRCLLVMYHIWEKGGFKSVICSKMFYIGPVARFWGPVFVFSKVFEYFDTFFIVVRKQKLIFLHWYHHFTVSLYCWWSYGGQYAGGGLFMTVNFTVHAMMYTYYTIRASGIKAPKPIAVLITTSQIAQMVIGCITMYSVNLWRSESGCKSDANHIFYGGIMYGSYLVLFVQFFISAYFGKSPAPSGQKKEIQPSTLKFDDISKKSVHANGNGVQLRQRHN